MGIRNNSHMHVSLFILSQVNINGEAQSADLKYFAELACNMS